MTVETDLIAKLATCNILLPERTRCPQTVTHHAVVSWWPGYHPEFDMCADHALGHRPGLYERVLAAQPLRLVARRRPWAPEWTDVHFAGRMLGTICDLATSGILHEGTWYPWQPYDEPYRWAARTVQPGGDPTGPRSASVGEFVSEEKALDALIGMYPPVAEHLQRLSAEDTADDPPADNGRRQCPECERWTPAEVVISSDHDESCSAHPCNTVTAERVGPR